MEEVKCRIKRNEYVGENHYVVVKEVVSEEEHFIPSYQLTHISETKNGEELLFLKKYNRRKGKYFLELINPSFKVGSECELKIAKRKYIGKELFFELESEYEYNPPLSLKAYHWQEDYNYIKCKVQGYLRGRPWFKNIDLTNFKWKLNETYLFKIKGFSSYISNKGLKVDTLEIKIDDQNTKMIKAGLWHKKDIWPYDDIKCRVIGKDNHGLPKMYVYDDRHPFYKIGKKYNFIVCGFEKKYGHKTNSFYKIIRLGGRMIQLISNTLYSQFQIKKID